MLNIVIYGIMPVIIRTFAKERKLITDVQGGL